MTFVERIGSLVGRLSLAPQDVDLGRAIELGRFLISRESGARRSAQIIVLPDGEDGRFAAVQLRDGRATLAFGRDGPLGPARRMTPAEIEALASALDASRRKYLLHDAGLEKQELAGELRESLCARAS